MQVACHFFVLVVVVVVQMKYISSIVQYYKLTTVNWTLNPRFMFFVRVSAAAASIRLLRIFCKTCSWKRKTSSPNRLLFKSNTLKHCYDYSRQEIISKEMRNIGNVTSRAQKMLPFNRATKYDVKLIKLCTKRNLKNHHMDTIEKLILTLKQCFLDVKIIIFKNENNFQHRFVSAVLQCDWHLSTSKMKNWNRSWPTVHDNKKRNKKFK